MKARIEKEVNFSAGHTIPSHPKCSRMHGHNYRVIVVVEGEVDNKGMLVDFGEIKNIVMTLDHRYLVGTQDIVKQISDEEDIYHMSVPHATAEWIAHWIVHQVGNLAHNISYVSAELWETPDSKVFVEQAYGLRNISSYTYTVSGDIR